MEISLTRQLQKAAALVVAPSISELLIQLVEKYQIDNNDAVLLRSSILQHTRFMSASQSREEEEGDGEGEAEAEEGVQPQLHQGENDTREGDSVHAAVSPTRPTTSNRNNSALPSSPPAVRRVVPIRNDDDDLAGRKDLAKIRRPSQKLDWCVNFKAAYDVKKANGVSFTDLAKTWVRQTLLPITHCLSNHCGNNYETFILKHTTNFKTGKFKCSCDEDRMDEV